MQSHEGRILALENRITQLENELQHMKIQHAQTASPMIKQKPIIKKIEEKPPQKKKDWEKEIGQVWLPRIFVFILLLGVIWGFKASIDAGFMNEPMRIVCGILVGIGLFYFGEKQIRQHRTALGLVLLGGSVAAFVLTTFAAHYLYGYVPATLAFVLNICWTALGIWTSYRHRSEWLAIFVGFSGYLVPFLINSTHPNVLVFAGYEWLLYVSLLLFATKQNYRILYYIAFGFLHVSLAVYNIAAHDHSMTLAFAVLLQHLCILYIVLTKRTFYFTEQLGVLGASFILTALWVNMLSPYLGIRRFFIFTAILYAGIYIWERQKHKQTLLLDSALTLSFYSIGLFALIVLDAAYYPLLWIIQGFISIQSGWRLNNRIIQYIGTFSYGCGALLTVTSSFAFLFSLPSLTWGVYLITFVILIKQGKQYLDMKKQAYWIQFSMVAFFISIPLFVSQLSHTILLAQNRNIQQFTLSSLWMLYAFCLMIYGNRQKNKISIYAGFCMIGITLLKLFFFDLFTIGLTIRAILFLLVGVIGIFISRNFYQKQNK